MWPAPTRRPSEVDQMIDVCKEHGPVTSILDLGGRHADLLASAGFEVVDVVKVAPGQTFDAVAMMDSALGQWSGEDALRSTLDVVRGHLRPGGLFLFDVLDGNAVLGRSSHNRFTRIGEGDAEFVTAVRGSVDVEESVLRLDVQRWHLAGGRLVDSAEETLLVRFFLPRELELVLRVNGFRLLGTAPMAEGQRIPSYEVSRLAWARLEARAGT